MTTTSASATKTRSTTTCPIFGSSEALPQNFLPSYADVLKHYLFVRSNLKLCCTSKEPPINEISERVAADIKNIWLKASIPCITQKKIAEKVKLYHEKYRNVLKPFKGRQKDPAYIKKIECFGAEARVRLFDVSFCKCADYTTCRCEKGKRVPIAERDFLTDQRNEKQMMIGGVDYKKTKKIQNSNTRKEIAARNSQKQPKFSSNDDRTGKLNEEETTEEITKKNYSDSEEIQTATTSQMRLSLPNLAMVCDRYGISDRAGAAVASAVLNDFNIICDADTSKIVDRNKVRREREKLRQDLSSSQQNFHLTALFFDGRKDKTLVHEKVENKFRNILRNEEHVTLLQEPGSIYIGHITPANGKASSIKEKIMEHLNRKEIATNDLVAIGCDGTNVNTGVDNGVIRLMEVSLERPLQWLICMLHINELPLRHLFQHLDGETSGPRAYSGPIGKSLKKCENLPLVKFSPIKGNELPAIDFSELSSDQRVLHEAWCIVSAGESSPEFPLKKLGPLNHSRWLTTAIRILRLYISSENPSKNLCILCEYVMKVYVPVWFLIKAKPHCSDGSRHLWALINNSRYLEPDLQDIIDPVIQRNSYFAHEENLLLAMLTDDRKHIRELAFRRIKAARYENQQRIKLQNKNVRKFKVPKINFAAADYVNLIDWNQRLERHVKERMEPPITRSLEIEKIERIKNDALGADTETLSSLFKLPCHTQATERTVKLVTEASEAVCGYERRDGYIRTKIESRSRMKTFDTKRNYKVQNKSV